MDATTPGAAPVELRCGRHLHGKVVGDVVEVRCHQCTKGAGRPVFHRWRLVVTGIALIMLDDDPHCTGPPAESAA